jgi:hypothetical protein
MTRVFVGAGRGSGVRPQDLVGAITAGSTGDVAPYTGVGARLREAGHQVTVAAHESFADLVAGAGLDLLPIPGDVRAVQASALGRELYRRGTGMSGMVSMARLAGRYVWELAEGMLAVAERGPDVLLLSTTTAALGYQVAQALGVPSMGLFLQPVDATGDFPPVMVGTRRLGRAGNRAAAALAACLPAGCTTGRPGSCVTGSACRRCRCTTSTGGSGPNTGRSCTVSARPWYPGRRTGDPASMWSATGGRPGRRTGSHPPNSSSSSPPSQRRYISDSAAWPAAGRSS